MTDAVVVALLSLLGTLSGAYLAQRKSAALIAYRLEQLEQKVSKHNQLVERTYRLEQHSALQDERWQEAARRLDSLERA